MYFKNKKSDLQDSFKLLQKHNKRYPKFLQTPPKTIQKRISRLFQATSKTKQKGSLRCFKLLQKPGIQLPKILSNYFKNKTREIPNSFKLLQNQYRKIQQNTSKTEHKGSRDCFKLLHFSKQKVSPRFFQTLKIKQKRSPRFFKLCTFKTRKGISKILSNYFKNRTKAVPEIFSNYFIFENRMSPQDFFKLLQE